MVLVINHPVPGEPWLPRRPNLLLSRSSTGNLTSKVECPLEVGGFSLEIVRKQSHLRLAADNMPVQSFPGVECEVVLVPGVEVLAYSRRGVPGLV